MRYVLLMAFLLAAMTAHAERCLVTWYGAEMRGRNADGSPWQPNGISAAHRSLPFGTIIQACFRGTCATGPIRDRGPRPPACLDLSRGFAQAIGMSSSAVLQWHVVSYSARPVTRRRAARIVAPPVFNPFNLFDIFK